MLQQLLLHCYFHFCYINCWLILTSCCKTRRKMLVFDRPSILPLTLVFSILQSTIQPPISIWYMHKSLVAGRKTRGYTRYSPTLFSPFIVLPDRPLQSTLEPWSPGAEDPRSLLRHWVPRGPGVVRRFLGRRPHLFDHVVFVLAFLRQPCILVSVLRYFFLLPLTLRSRAVVFEPSWPLSCNIKLVLLYL